MKASTRKACRNRKHRRTIHAALAAHRALRENMSLESYDYVVRALRRWLSA